MILKNEKGNITLLGLMSLIITSGFIGIYLLQNRYSIKKIKQDLNDQICIKEMLKDKSTLINEIETLNTLISLTYKSEIITLFIPGLQFISGKAHKVRKALEIYQDYKFASKMKNSLLINKRHCPNSPSQFKTPYKHKVLALKRDKHRMAKLHSNKWTEVWKGINTIYQIKVEVKGKDTSYLVKRIRL